MSIRIKIPCIYLLSIWFLSTTLLFAEQVADNQAAEDKSSAIRFYLVRHGQTYSNIKEATIGGGGNAELTPKGRKDAYALGLGFKDAGIKFHAAYSSKLQRAYQTATEILAGQGATLPVEQRDGLQDISWGIAEGGRIADLKEKYGKDGNDFSFYFGNYFNPDYKLPVEGTETTREFSLRFGKALEEIAKENSEGTINILVAAHSTIGFYLSQFEDGQPKGTPNTSASIVEYKNGGFTMVEFGNTKFLEKGLELYKALKPLKILLVSSPETIFKEVGVVEGTSDSKLSDKGIKSAQSLKTELGKNKITAVYRSDLNRSRATSEIALEGTQVPIVDDPRLNELFLGYWEAEKAAVLEEKDKENFTYLHSQKDIAKLPVLDGRGEAVSHAVYRLAEMLNTIGAKYQADNGMVVVFTHPFILKAYMNTFFPDVSGFDDTTMQLVTLYYKDEGFKADQPKQIKK